MHRLTVDFTENGPLGVKCDMELAVQADGKTSLGEAFVAHVAMVLVYCIGRRLEIPEIESVMNAVSKNAAFEEDGTPDVNATIANMLSRHHVSNGSGRG